MYANPSTSIRFHTHGTQDAGHGTQDMGYIWTHMDTYAYIWIVDMGGGPRARPWPKTGGEPKWAKVPGPCRQFWAWLYLGTIPPLGGGHTSMYVTPYVS